MCPFADPLCSSGLCLSCNGFDPVPVQVRAPAGGEVVRIPQSLSAPERRWLNVVLDLNGILCVCEEFRFTVPPITMWNPESDPHSSSVPTKIGPKAVYVRPGCSDFLRSLQEFAIITVWSSMKGATTQQICKYLFRGLSMPQNILGQEYCERIKVRGPRNSISFLKVKGTQKDVFLKTLATQLFPRFNGQYSGLNTIVVDDSPLKHILNNFGNVLLPDTWVNNYRGQSDTFLGGSLLPYLWHIHSRQDILLGRNEQPRIGQRMMNEDPKSVEYNEVLEAIDRSHWL